MTTKLDQFEYYFKMKLIRTVLESGSAPSAKWIIPVFLKKEKMFLSNLLGGTCLEIYNNLNKLEKEEALFYVENCGMEVCKILKCKVFEENNEPQKIEMSNLRDKYPKMYKDVMNIYK
jgi:hypothetical protein